MTTQFVNSFPSINDKSMIYFGPTADASATRANQISSRKYEYIWTKPDGCRFVFIMAVGGGGGGGGGGSYPIGTKSCGGGGGAGSAVVYHFYNAITIPNVLYVSPGCGGLGGSGGSNGAGGTGLDGTISLVSLNPNKTSASVALIATGQISTQQSGTGGGGGTSSTGGSLGYNYAGYNSANYLFSLMFQTLGADSITPGQDYAYGVAGGNNGVGSSNIQNGGALTFGGAGGGGATSASIAFSGGSVYPVNNQNATVAGLFQYALGGTSGVDGESGFKFCAIKGPSIEGMNYPFVQCAGAGGGAQVNGNGGRGGDGAPGSGGGGGGAAVGTGVFGGSGGNGGPGFVIITPIF